MQVDDDAGMLLPAAGTICRGPSVPKAVLGERFFWGRGQVGRC